MTETPTKEVVAHWHKLIESFSTSSLDFYTLVEVALHQRKIPGLNISRVDWREGGILSPEREYLRVTGDRHVFDMCAAPFGTGFFFSSWVTHRRPKLVLLTFLILVAATTFLTTMFGSIPRSTFGIFGGELYVLFGPWVLMIAVPVVSFMVCLFFVAVMARAGNAGPELAVLAMPFIGAFYKGVFASETYYRIDTMLMFQSAVHSAMLEVIDGVTTQKGVRGLSDDDRKPVFYKLM